MAKSMKILWVVVLVVTLAVGGAVCYFFNRTGLLFDAEEGVCPRCLSHDVRMWKYGFGVGDTENVIGGGALLTKILPSIIVMSVVLIGGNTNDKWMVTRVLYSW